MTCLVDTGVLVAARNPRDPLHPTAEPALRAALRGAWGRPLVSDYIADEAITLARKRLRNHAEADRFAAFLLGEPPFQLALALARVDAEMFAEARRVFHRYDDHLLSFTDCTSIALVRRLGAEGVVSFDSGFDGIVPRVDPCSA